MIKGLGEEEEEEDMDEAMFGGILEVARFCNQCSFSGKSLNHDQLPVNE